MRAGRCAGGGATHASDGSRSSPTRCPLSSTTLRATKAAGAKRLGLIPPYLFAEIDRKVQEKKRSGIDVISLGIGDPDLPTPRRIVSVLQEAAADPDNHRYPSYFGLAELRGAIANWYEDRFGATLDPKTEILPTLGSKDGISHVHRVARAGRRGARARPWLHGVRDRCVD